MRVWVIESGEYEQNSIDDVVGSVAYLTSDITESVGHFWPWDLADFKRGDR